MKQSFSITATSLLHFCKGDNKALCAIYSAWLPELYLVAFRYVKCNLEAEDVVADCFEKLLKMPIAKRKQKFIVEEINLKALLLVMVRNRSLDVIRAKKIRYRFIEGLLNLVPIVGINGSKQTLTDENFKLLLDCLPEKERGILTLNIAGFSNNEIGKRMGIPEKTVSNKLSMARNKVKGLWKVFME